MDDTPREGRSHQADETPQPVVVADLDPADRAPVGGQWVGSPLPPDHPTRVRARRVAQVETLRQLAGARAWLAARGVDVATFTADQREALHTEARQRAHRQGLAERTAEALLHAALAVVALQRYAATVLAWLHTWGLLLDDLQTDQLPATSAAFDVGPPPDRPADPRHLARVLTLAPTAPPQAAWVPS